MPGYDSCEKHHKVGIKLMCPFVEKLLKFTKICGSGPKSAQKNCPVMPKKKEKLVMDTLLKAYVANFHVQISCVGKKGKLSRSCLSTIYIFESIQFLETLMTDGYFRIFLTK